MIDDKSPGTEYLPLCAIGASARFGCAAVLRVLQALDLTSASVGEPFSLIRIDADGTHHLSDEELEQVSDDVRRWEDAEQAAIAEIFK